MIRPTSLLLALGLLGSAILTGCSGASDPGSLGSVHRGSSNGGTAQGGGESTSGGQSSTNNNGSGAASDGSGGTGSSGSAGNTGNADAGTTTGTGADAATATTIEDTCVASINTYRATKGLPALTRWTDEEKCADGQAKSDSQSGTAHGAFGSCQEMAQNECPGWPGPEDTMITGCLDMMWKEGPGGGHYENMSNRQYTQVSCGFFTTTDGQIWSVQNFR